MAASLYTDCSSMQGSTTSSSCDMMTLTTAASSWCAIPACTRIRLIRLLRPHSRRILVTPGTVPSYGFSVRGGKEFNTGFFVSSVDRNSEAEQKGLKIGDQILRINGFKIDDAIHKEFIQLISHQERLTLKVRSVGMLPVKDKDNDCLTWNVVKAPSISSTTSECSYQSSERTEGNQSRNQSERVINVVLNVAPRTKLGLGICKGPEWKPGIYVQFTKEKSVAREAGLRPGDQILTVNSIDFSDVLFSEAVAVMKSSNKLDMTVHTAAGCDLFPGESSGYNSSASSVTGDQSPCWADVKSKRLTSVREESSAQTMSTNYNLPLYANERKCRTKSITERSSNSNPTATNLPIRQASCTQPNVSKEINKTIIKLSENGATSINNTFVGNEIQSSNTGTIRKTLANCQKDTAEESSAMEGTLTKCNQISKTASVLPPPPPMTILNPARNHHHYQHHHHQHQPLNKNSLNFSNDSLMTSTLSSTTSSSTNSSSNTYAKSMLQDEADIKIGGVAATMQRYQYANLQLAKLTKASTNTNIANDNSAYSNVNLNMESEKSNSCYNSGGGSLSSAITEELKKRKARRQTPSFNERAPHNDTKPLQCDTKRENNNDNNHLRANATQTIECMNNDRRHHHRHYNINTTATTTAATTTTNNINSNHNNNNTLNVVGDQHNALMNEFKQAHKRMFKNGFRECAGVESVENRDRKEALLNTIFMDDAGTYRSKATKSNKSQDVRQPTEKLDNENSQLDSASHIPKPPPFLMTSKDNSCKSTNNNNSAGISTLNNKSNKTFPMNDEMVGPRLSNSSQTANTNAFKSDGSYSPQNKPAPTNANRQTLRLGTVTIGEYRQQTLRREPEKFDFISTQKRGRDSGDTTPTNEALHSELQNTLSRSNLRKSNGSSYTEHQVNCPLHQQQQKQHRQSLDGSSSRYTIHDVSIQLQKTSLNENSSSELLTKTNNHRSANGTAPTTGVGILKHGSRNGTNGSIKSTEKSIKFG